MADGSARTPANDGYPGPTEQGRAGPAANVGRWFSTAAAPTIGGTGSGTGEFTSDGRTLPADVQPPPQPRIAAWGPDPHARFGERSSDEEIASALELLRGRPTAVLTGAGMSTASGLPDYRGPDAVARSPMTYQEFIGSDLSRRRYWARSTVGWTQFTRARPNPAHRALAGLAGALPMTAVITQNVDGLHQQAGSSPVIDLHGRLDRVRCLSCQNIITRDSLHARLLAMNPQVAAQLDELAADAAQAPDGDAEVDRTASFRYPECGVCGGMLKPDVVFFGENAAGYAVSAAFDALGRAEALLVLGSSLTVMSGLRFARRAVTTGKDLVIVNDGPTRADDLATVRLHGMLDEVLQAWVSQVDT